MLLAPLWVLALAFLCCLFIVLAHSPALESFFGGDVVNTPLLTGTGVVLRKEAHYGGSKNPGSSLLGSGALMIEFQIGRFVGTAYARDEQKWARANVGDTVQVTYRAGKKNVVVEDWVPISQPAKK